MDKNTNQNDLQHNVEQIPNDLNKNSIIHRELSIHSGPLPSPESLKQYEEASPGAAKEIIALAVNQAKHRQEMERVKVKSASRDSLLGLVFAFIFCIVTIAGAIHLTDGDHTLSGLFLGGVGFTTVVTTFIRGKSDNK